MNKTKNHFPTTLQSRKPGLVLHITINKINSFLFTSTQKMNINLLVLVVAWSLAMTSFIQTAWARRAFYDEELPEDYFQRTQEKHLPRPSKLHENHETSKEEVHRDYDHGIKHITSPPANRDLETDTKSTVTNFEISPKSINGPVHSHPLAGQNSESGESGEDIVGIFSLEEVKPGSKLKVVFKPRSKSVVSLASTNSRRNNKKIHNQDVQTFTEPQKKPEQRIRITYTSEKTQPTSEETDEESQELQLSTLRPPSSLPQLTRKLDRLNFKLDGDEDGQEQDEDLLTTDQDPELKVAKIPQRPPKPNRNRPTSRYHQPSTSPPSTTTTSPRPKIASRTTRKPTLPPSWRNRYSYNDEDQDDIYYDDDDDEKDEIVSATTEKPSTTTISRNRQSRPSSVTKSPVIDNENDDDGAPQQSNKNGNSKNKPPLKNQPEPTQRRRTNDKIHEDLEGDEEELYSDRTYDEEQEDATSFRDNDSRKKQRPSLAKNNSRPSSGEHNSRQGERPRPNSSRRLKNNSIPSRTQIQTEEGRSLTNRGRTDSHYSNTRKSRVHDSHNDQ